MKARTEETMHRFSRVFSVLSLVFAAHLASGQGTTTPAKPTREEIQKMMEAKSYRPAIKAIAQILPAGKGASADRYALLMMRAECLIQTKDNATAIIAL